MSPLTDINKVFHYEIESTITKIIIDIVNVFKSMNLKIMNISHLFFAL